MYAWNIVNIAQLMSIITNYSINYIEATRNWKK